MSVVGRLVGIVAVVLAIMGQPASYAEPSGVDLVISGIVPSATEAPKVLVVVRNRGSLPLARSFEVELWLDEQLLAKQQVKQDLYPNKPLYVEFLRPTEMPHGLHNFTATVDPDDEIKELTEENNGHGITVWVKGTEQATQGDTTQRGR